MKIQSFSHSGFFDLKNSDWLEKQRIAGKVVAGVLSLLKNYVDNQTSLSLLELDRLAETYIRDHSCTPTFKNYKGFPAACCISVNKILVHGIPTDYHLQNKDMVSFDLGATFQGAIADSALTCVFGAPSPEQTRIISATENALLQGINAIKPGNHLGCIGSAIYKATKNSGYSIITHYGGHHLTWDTPHSEPFVANKAEPNEGIRIQPGTTMAIEPMLTSGSTKTYLDKDGWTVWCEAELSAHQEHTIFIHQDSVEIITQRI